MPDTDLPHPPPAPDIDTALIVARRFVGERPDHGTSLIVVGFHDHVPVAVARRTTDPSMPAPLVTGEGIDSAVLILLDTPRHLGAALVLLPATLRGLGRAGVASVAVIGCHTLRPGTAWTDLSSTATHDGRIPAHLDTPRPRRTKPVGAGAWRVVGEVVGIGLGLCTIGVLLWVVLSTDVGQRLCRPTVQSISISRHTHKTTIASTGIGLAGSWGSVGEVAR